MSSCTYSLFSFFTAYSHIRILSLRTPLFFVLLFLRHIPTFEFFLLGPRSLDFSNVTLCRFIVRLFLQHIPTFEFFLLGPPLTRFFKCRLVRIHCSPFLQHITTFEFFLLGPRYSLFYFFTSYSHIRILTLRTPLIRFFQCRLVRIHCSPFLQHITTFEFFLLGPRYSLFYFFYIIFPHSNSFS